MKWEHNTDPGFWIEAFQNVETADSLRVLFATWWRFWRNRCADPAAVIAAKNKRKAELPR